MHAPCQLSPSRGASTPRKQHAPTRKANLHTVSRGKPPSARTAAPLFERKNSLPVVLHADDSPAVLLRLIVKRLRKSADLRIGKPLRRTIGVFAPCIVVQQQHHQSRTIACSCVLQHLPITGRVAESRARAAADLQMDALRF